MEREEAKKTISALCELQLKTLSLAEYSAWLNSEPYLEFVCVVHNWRKDDCGKERAQLQEIYQKKRKRAWIGACEAAWGWSWETKKSKLKFGSVAHLRAAIGIFQAALHVPLSWRTPFECQRCGIVLIERATEELFGGGTECPWCAYLPRIEKEPAYASPLSDFWDAYEALRSSQESTAPLKA